MEIPSCSPIYGSITFLQGTRSSITSPLCGQRTSTILCGPILPFFRPFPARIRNCPGNLGAFFLLSALLFLWSSFIICYCSPCVSGETGPGDVSFSFRVRLLRWLNFVPPGHDRDSHPATTKGKQSGFNMVAAVLLFTHFISDGERWRRLVIDTKPTHPWVPLEVSCYSWTSMFWILAVCLTYRSESHALFNLAQSLNQGLTVEYIFLLRYCHPNRHTGVTLGDIFPKRIKSKQSKVTSPFS